VDSRFKFSLLTMAGEAAPVERPRYAFFCHRVPDLERPGKVFTLTPEEIALLNPNTRTCPVFRTQRDAELTKAIYRRVPVLVREGDPNGNPWDIRFQLMFMMNTASHLFRTRDELELAGGALRGNRWTVPEDATVDGKEIAAGEWLPLCEAKMIHHFDHRWATYDVLERARGKKAAGDVDTRDVTLDEKRDPAFVAQPRYWVHAAEVDRAAASPAGWFLGWRKTTNSTNERTLIWSLVPRAAVGDKLQLAQADRSPVLCMLGCANSLVVDFVARNKIGGTDMTFMYTKQLAMLPPSVYDAPCPWRGAPPTPNPHRPTPNPLPLSSFLLPRVLELTYTAHDLEAFARDLGYEGPPFRWDEERRFRMRAELDAAFFRLYGIAREDAAYILDTFPIVRRKDIAAHGRYRTKEAILAVYDALAEAERTGAPYRSPLDPPPAGGWLPAERAEEAPPRRPEPVEAFELRPPPEPPAPRPAPDSAPSLGERVLVNGRPAILLATERAGGAETLTVLFDGEERPRKYVSPPARVEPFAG